MKSEKIQKLMAENKCPTCGGKGMYSRIGYASRDAGYGVTATECYSKGGPCPVCGGTGEFSSMLTSHHEYWLALAGM